MALTNPDLVESPRDEGHAGKERRRQRRGDWWRLGLLACMLVAGVVLVFFTPLGEHLDREQLVQDLEALGGNPWAPLIFVGLYLPLSLLGVPLTPLVFAGGFIFGAFWGSVWNVTGAVLGSILTFLVARSLGYDAVTRLVGEERLMRLEPHLERHAFTVLVGSRFLPIPSTAVNVAAAVAGVKLATFSVSTVLGFVLPIAVMTWLGSAVARSAAGGPGASTAELIAAGVAVLCIIAVPAWWLHRWRKSL